VRTDGSPIYARLQDEEFDHDRRVMLGSKAPAHQPLRGVHRVAALLKRWLLGTHHGAVDPRDVDSTAAARFREGCCSTGFLTFTMHFLHWNPGHLLGRFRLSVTTDNRSTYADGLTVGGNVTANWTLLQNLVVQGPSGMTFANLRDESVLAGGSVPGQGIYDVSAETDLTGITGIRPEVLKPPNLPAEGPGSTRTGIVSLRPIPRQYHVEVAGHCWGTCSEKTRKPATR
jgi:ISXO2-like transposase domain